MSITTLETAKSHLRVEHTDDDALIQIYIDAAEAQVNNYCDQAEVFDEFPAPVAAAVLLIVGDLYENREAQNTIQLHANKTVEFLLSPYRALGV